jgi:Lrp/AsnC family transcriptional regulator for asnA, asnC and gidA
MKDSICGSRVEIDRVDLKIIDILKNDASRTFVDIGKEIGVSDATVHIRVRKMISLGIINKFTINVNNNLLGYDHLAFVGIKTKPGSVDVNIMSELSRIHEVLEIHEMHGIFDLLIKIRAKNLEEMRDVVENKILKLPQIVEVEIMPILKTEMEEQVCQI